MDIRTLKPGDRVRTVDGVVVDVIANSQDGEHIPVRYVECAKIPSIVGTEGSCHADELKEIINKYPFTVSRLTVDKLGVKLYDRVSAVLAELVANSYDADATKVEISAPMGTLLAIKQGDQLVDQGFAIEVKDDGIGMTPDEVRRFYLVVGAERRADAARGDVSPIFKRKVMGRKGVGKLAPFGICQRIEVLTSGGGLIDGKDANGRPTRGYLTAHLILDRDRILSDTDKEYDAELGALDGTVRPERGTLLRLSGFTHRRVPSIEDLSRQLSQRFGIASANWVITLTDSQRGAAAPDQPKVVGIFDVAVNPETHFRFESEKDTAGQEIQPVRYRVYGPDGNIRSDMQATFNHEGREYPIRGWVAYSKEPYKDDLMAGVRIYCRGKIAAQTSIFNRRAGFTGEYDIRSYLVGEIHADWLDEEEDLIQTDRRDILWSHALGQAFEQWGQSIVRQMGRVSRTPMRKKTWEAFQEVSQIGERIEAAFPVPDQKPIRENAMEIAKLVGRTVREEELQDHEHTEALVQLSLNLAPHITLDKKLKEAAEATDSPLAVITGILKAARIAELSSFGQIADERVKVIGRVEALKDDPDTVEAALQNLISDAPWLIDPQWSPISANQSFSTLKAEFQKYYKAETGDEIELGNFRHSTKRADFVLSNQDGVIQIIEIKRPYHSFQNEEMVRLNRYVDVMTAFLREETNREFRGVFTDFHVTLVCDEEALTGVHKAAFEGLKSRGILDHINWRTFLLRTRKMHQDFLNEAERQKRDAAKG